VKIQRSAAPRHGDGPGRFEPNGRCAADDGRTLNFPLRTIACDCRLHCAESWCRGLSRRRGGMRRRQCRLRLSAEVVPHMRRHSGRVVFQMEHFVMARRSGIAGKKRGGAPATGKATLIGLPLEPELLARVDRWAASQKNADEPKQESGPYEPAWLPLHSQRCPAGKAAVKCQRELF
jgi:hypothetical protein